MLNLFVGVAGMLEVIGMICVAVVMLYVLYKIVQEIE